MESFNNSTMTSVGEFDSRDLQVATAAVTALTEFATALTRLEGVFPDHVLAQLEFLHMNLRSRLDEFGPNQSIPQDEEATHRRRREGDQAYCLRKQKLAEFGAFVRAYKQARPEIRDGMLRIAMGMPFRFAGACWQKIIWWLTR